MATVKLQRLIELYRDGYITRDQLIHYVQSLREQGQNVNISAENPREINIDLDKAPIAAAQRTQKHGLPWARALVLILSLLALILIYSEISLPPFKDFSVATFTSWLHPSSADRLTSSAESLMKTTHWPPKAVQNFQRTWETLDKAEQESVKKSLWYKKFSLYLALQLAQLESLAHGGNMETSKEIVPLRKLSRSLGNEVTLLADPVTHKPQRIKLKELAQSKPVPGKPTKAPLAQTTKLSAPSRKELNALIQSYTQLYEQGKTSDLMALFSGSGWNQGEIGDFELRERFRETFARTSKRQIKIENIHWSFKGSAAMGTGELTLNYFDTEARQRHHEVGNIRVVALRENNKIRFSHLYHIF